jgi:hypothetical protein
MRVFWILFVCVCAHARAYTHMCGREGGGGREGERVRELFLIIMWTALQSLHFCGFKETADVWHKRGLGIQSG